MTLPARHLRVSIRRPAQQVYEFAADPENLPRWAAGLSGSIREDGDAWIAQSPMGNVRVRFTEKNG